jgi:MoaA/NifB/PqqE/SkfB family radical SAM enzyme
MLILEPTLACNAQCTACYNLDDLNTKGATLSLDTVSAIAAALPDLVSLLLSGGEPTLYAELPALVGIFAQRDALRYVHIPTNGFLPERLGEQVEEICDLFSREVVVSLSIDGIGARHDEIRVLPKNFERLTESYRVLCDLKRRLPNLHISANTCISALNHPEARDVIEWVRANWPEVEGHSASVVRQPDDDAALFDAAEFLGREGPWLSEAARARRRYELGVAGRMSDMFWSFYYREAQHHHEGGERRWRCSALDGSLYINARGEVFGCEMRPPIGALTRPGSLPIHESALPRATLSELLVSPGAEREREHVEKRLCSCDHGCFMQHSAFTEPANLSMWLRGALSL